MLANIERPHPANTPGACYLQLIPVTQVSAVPQEVAGAISTAITVISGGAWITIEPTRFTQEFKESWQLRQGAQVAMASLECLVPKDRVELLHDLYTMGFGRHLVLHHDMNGNIKLLGTKKEPAMVRVELLEHGKGLRSGDANQYRMRVDVARSRMCPFYLQDPPSAVPVCETLPQLIAGSDGVTIFGYMTSEQIEDGVQTIPGDDLWNMLTTGQQDDVLAEAGIVEFDGIDDSDPYGSIMISDE